MTIGETVLIAFGLAMDAFAVSITCGIGTSYCIKLDKQPSIKCAIKVGVFFGFFQFFMPILGWLLGVRVLNYIVHFDHWIAFGLLAFIGCKMILDSFDTKERIVKSSICETNSLFILAIATSIDAMIIGLSLAILKANLLMSIIIIGLITFITSFLGVYLGKSLGKRIKINFALLGGLVLIGIGIKILTEHLIHTKV